MLPTSTLADAVLPIAGIFGNGNGCHFFMTGDVLGDDLLVLTPDTFSSFATACYFEALIADHGNAYEIAASCSNEGEEGSSKSSIVVSDRGARGMFVAFEGLEEFGPMLPCPGTESLFPERGTLI
jgi:hypothetical protein